jgi:6-pyruvoyltetrahydropterin/6-carboxytetrahydropterin synthase
MECGSIMAVNQAASYPRGRVAGQYPDGWHERPSAVQEERGRGGTLHHVSSTMYPVACPNLPIYPLQMPFEITTTRTFTAAHQLRMYDSQLEPPHEHLWRVCVTLAADELDSIGVVIDFSELERLMDEILAPLSGRSLNAAPAFADRNPSAENVALHIAERLALPSRVKLVSVQVWETEGNSATYRR